MDNDSRYIWDVESAAEEAGRVSVSLLRRRERSVGRLRPHTEILERTVFFSRSFRPLLESVLMERYAERLRRIAGYSEAGQFGCFAQTQSEGGSVEVVLWERSFDGTDIHTEELARRAFDAGDEQSLVASVEFLAELQLWAERRNEEREAIYLQTRDADDTRARLLSEQAEAGRELSRILAAQARAR